MTRTSLPRRRWLALAAAGTLATFAASGAQAQPDWPQFPIKLVVPYAPGGANDVTLRLVSKRVAEKLGQSIIVENRPGAGGVVGTNVVVKAPPDGYTIGVGATSTLIATPLTNVSSTLVPEKDLAFVALLASSPMLLVANNSLPVHSAADLPKLLKDQRGKLSYGSMAVGHFGHVLIKELSDTYAANMVHSPYKGEAPLLQGLMGGEIQLALITPPAVRAMAEAGRVKLLGVSGTKRLKLFPNVPTLAEQGFTAPIFSMNAGWIGIIAPAGTPAAIVKKLGAAYDQAVRDPDIHEKLVDLGLDPIGGDGAMFQATYERERPVWRKLLVGAGLDVKPE